MKKKHNTLLFLLLTSVLGYSAPKVNIKVDSLINQMTLEEKISFIGGYNEFFIRGIERLGIPEVRMSDGPVGVRLSQPAVALPANIAIASSFNTNIAKQYGAAIGSEARSNNIHIMLGPGMNIHRSPFCGRNFEYMGEDPYLAGKLAASYIIGMQNEGVMATAKHYAANFQEYNRHHISSNIDERTLHELYLPAFKRCVEEGEVAAVMTAYNLINGVHASEHDYLNNKILKGEWGFNGFIVSDWASTYDGLACAKGGLDLEMPSGKMMNSNTLLPAIQNGTLELKIIDDKIRRILTEYKRFGLLENANIAKGYTFDKSTSQMAALKTAREGIVLLKNEHRFLPIDVKKIKNVAVIGPNGEPAVTGGGGSSHVKTLSPISVFQAVKSEVGDKVNVTFNKGVSTGNKIPEDFFDNLDFYTKDKTGNKISGVYAEFYNNINLEGGIIATKSYKNMNLKREDFFIENMSIEEFSTRFTCYFSPKESGEYWVAAGADDGYRLFVDGKKTLESWKRQGVVIEKYHAFFEKGKEYKFVFEYFQSGGGAGIKFGTLKYTQQEEDSNTLMQAAIESAKKADLVILTVGFDTETEAEGFDRTFELPFNQNELIQNILAVNKNAVVVLNAGGNVEMNSWIDKVKGILHAWYPGENGNKAVSEIIFGKTNPSGKLPVSFEYKPEDNPTFKSYYNKDANDLNVEFTEGIFMGYRFYDKSVVKPRFPFGFGLSYTTFAYGKVKTPLTTIKAGEKLRFTVDIKNTGKMDGAEAVQVYVSDLKSSLARPVKELKAFSKVFLKKGETKTIDFELDKDAFSFYDPTKHGWIIEPGNFKILIGSSSVDIRKVFNLLIK